MTDVLASWNEGAAQKAIALGAYSLKQRVVMILVGIHRSNSNLGLSASQVIRGLVYVPRRFRRQPQTSA